MIVQPKSKTGCSNKDSIHPDYKDELSQMKNIIVTKENSIEEFSGKFLKENFRQLLKSELLSSD